MEKSLQVVSKQDRLDNWTSRIMECRNSGMSIRAWCWENGFNEKTYYYWQRRLFQELSARQDCPESGSLVDITPVQPVRSSGGISVTVRLAQAEADIHSGADPETVAMVLRLLKSC